MYQAENQTIHILADVLLSICLWTFPWNTLLLGHDTSKCLHNERYHLPWLHRHPQIHFHFSLKKSNSSARWLLESVPAFMDCRYFLTFLKNYHHYFDYYDLQDLSYWHNYFLTSFLNFLKRDNSRFLCN